MISGWYKTARDAKPAPIPENYDGIDRSEKPEKWTLCAGSNDWERTWSFMAIEIDLPAKTRIWATINYSLIKGYKNTSDAPGDKELEAAAKKWAKRATEEWVVEAKRLLETSKAYEYSWQDACIDAIQSDRMSEFVDEWGIEHLRWQPEDPDKTVEKIRALED